MGGGRVPTVATTGLRDTSHGTGHTHGRLGLGEPGASPARFLRLMALASDHLSHLRGLQGSRARPAPRAGSTQSARVLGTFQQPGEARPDAHLELGRLSLGHPQPSAAAPPLMASGWPWVQGTRREAPKAGRGQQTQGCSSLCPRPQAPGRGWGPLQVLGNLPQPPLLSQGPWPAGTLFAAKLPPWPLAQGWLLTPKALFLPTPVCPQEPTILGRRQARRADTPAPSSEARSR